MSFRNLLLRNLNLARINQLLHLLRALAINLASNRERRTQNLLDRPAQILSHTLEPHGTRNVDDLIERDGLGMLDVLLLLAVAGWLLERLDDEGGGRGDDGDGGLTVLDGELDGDAEAFPVACCFGDVFTDLLW